MSEKAVTEAMNAVAAAMGGVYHQDVLDIDGELWGNSGSALQKILVFCVSGKK